MARVIVTLKIMPEGTSTNLDEVSKNVIEKINFFGGEVGKQEIEPVAFGLCALKVFFVMDEAKGSTEKLEQDIAKIKGISSVEVIDVRRAIG